MDFKEDKDNTRRSSMPKTPKSKKSKNKSINEEESKWDMDREQLHSKRMIKTPTEKIPISSL